ncbi:regulator of chromosome condensation 1/beta-lactamase-inhibitor protein II, partial [Lasiosphaeris hirsuta]
LFALGSNGSGQLGIGHKEDVSVPKPVLFSTPLTSPITKIAGGGNHTLLLTASGTVYCAGDHSTSACGKLPPSPQPPAKFHPLEIITPTPEPVTHVAATWEVTVLATPTKVYTLGAGLKGELGLGPFLFRTSSPSAIPDFPPTPSQTIADLSASMAHAVAVLSDGTAHGWGTGRHGQLGSPAAAVVDAPREIGEVPFFVVRAVCGRDFTCLFGTPESGEFVALGSDKWGVRSAAPAAEAIKGWRDVGAGWGGVYVLRGDGSVLSWGRDDHGQMAPADLASAERIAVGSEHAVALSKEGDVTAWGWGEHGNCGPPVEDEKEGQAPKGRRNVIASSKYVPPGASITAIGAGCATSWIALKM